METRALTKRIYTTRAQREQIKDDVDDLVDGLHLFEPFCKQAANAMCRLYGNENNKWALLMPGLIHRVSTGIGSTVGDICQSSMDEQLTFLPELLDTIKPPEDAEVDERLEKAIKIREVQLSSTPSPAVSLNPFRELPKETEEQFTGPDPEEDPDLIV